MLWCFLLTIFIKMSVKTHLMFSVDIFDRFYQWAIFESLKRCFTTLKLVVITCNFKQVTKIISKQGCLTENDSTIWLFYQNSNMKIFKISTLSHEYICNNVIITWKYLDYQNYDMNKKDYEPKWQYRHFLHKSYILCVMFFCTNFFLFFCKIAQSSKTAT